MNKPSSVSLQGLPQEVVPSYSSFNTAAQTAGARLTFKEHQELRWAEQAAAPPRAQRLGTFINSESFLGATLVVQDLPLPVPMFGTQKQLPGREFVIRYWHLDTISWHPFWLNRFNSYSQNSEEEAIFAPSQEKRKKVQSRHGERSGGAWGKNPKNQKTKKTPHYLKSVSTPFLFSFLGLLSRLDKAEILQILHTALLEPRVPLIILWQLLNRQSTLHFIHLK